MRGIWSIPLPLPEPLRYVNIFALEVDEGAILVDAGWNSQEHLDGLKAGLAIAGRSLADVQGVIATHGHTDHYGLAGRLRDETGCWLALHAADAEEIEHRAVDDSDLGDLGRWQADWGLADDEIDEVGAVLRRIRSFRPTALPDVHLEPGDIVGGPWKLKVVHTPGHAPGHVCLVAEEAGVVFVGDHILSWTTPNISFWPGSRHRDPLGDYLASLQTMLAYDGFTTLPGHEDRVSVADRAAQILAHHERHLVAALDLVAAGAETVREVAAELPWDRPWDTFGGIDRFLALGEAHAHLLTLERRSRIAFARGTWLRWRLTAPARATS